MYMYMLCMYKWRAKMIFVRPGRKRGADTMSRLCEKVVSRTLKSVPNNKTKHFPKCGHSDSAPRALFLRFPPVFFNTTQVSPGVLCF